MTYHKEGSGNGALWILVFIVLVLGGAFYYFNRTPEEPVVGSVAIGGEYQSTTTRSYNGTALPNLRVLKDSSGTLGSVVITGAGTGIMTIYDATSTVTNIAWATTTLATFPASTAAGTYTFDAIARKGILVEITGAAASSTITFR